MGQHLHSSNSQPLYHFVIKKLAVIYQHDYWINETSPLSFGRCSFNWTLQNGWFWLVIWSGDVHREEFRSHCREFAYHGSRSYIETNRTLHWKYRKFRKIHFCHQFYHFNGRKLLFPLNIEQLFTLKLSLNVTSAFMGCKFTALRPTFLFV